MIQKEVADPIALALLKGEYVDGDVVVVDATSDGGLAFSRKAAVARLSPDVLRAVRVGAAQRVANQPGMAGT